MVDLKISRVDLNFLKAIKSKKVMRISASSEVIVLDSLLIEMSSFSKAPPRVLLAFFITKMSSAT